MRKTERREMQSSSLCYSPRTPNKPFSVVHRLSELKSKSYSKTRNHPQKNTSTIDTSIHWPESARTPQPPPTTIFNMSMLSTMGKLPRRNKIFGQLPQQYQHFTIGANLSNLQFQDLDGSLSLRLLATSKSCGCEDSTRCCQRIMKFTNLSKTRQMKKKYAGIKELRQALPYSAVRIRMQDVPFGYPQILLPHVENLLRLFPMKSTFDMKLLLTIVWHAKVQYLSYWIYNDLKQTSHNENFSQELLQMISDYSLDLKKYIENTGRDIIGIATLFQQSCGTAVIPTTQYAHYLQALNEQGRGYPKRVLFCLLLYCKKRLVEGKLDLDSLFQLSNLSNELPWQSIFSAARNSKLK